MTVWPFRLTVGPYRYPGWIGTHHHKGIYLDVERPPLERRP